MILIIDDDIAIRSSLSLFLESEGYEVLQAEKQGPALKALHSHPVSLMIMDMNFSTASTGEEGLELLQDVKDRWPAIPVILITGWGSIELAVKGMRLGASDFITKPWDNAHLLRSVHTCIQLHSEQNQRMHTRKELDAEFSFSRITGHHPMVIRLLDTIGRVAPTDAPILIQGESGTGKELIAEAIHANSERKNSPLVTVNMGAITPTLFESEMFGHKKGAFTNAISDRDGRFAVADGGSIFLDEIGELDMATQVKLLRTLQEKTFERVGDSNSIRSDFRLICATNKKLEDMVAAGTFREDLYYRINLITLEVPPLRERKDDIPMLTNHFLEKACRIYKKEALRVSPNAMEYIKGLSFPGNIRELKNLVERVALIAVDPVLKIEDFQCLGLGANVKAQHSVPAIPGQFTLDEMEKSMIEKTLKKTSGNLSEAARLLGLNRGQLYRRMEKFDLGKLNR